ncbi:MAG: SPOR domain-containing protein [Gallionella sp.]|nr:SPOR domain-containing protein [Gallionella sp.]
MKVWFWIVLLANVLLFGVMYSGVLDDHSAVLAQAPLNEQKIEVLSGADVVQASPDAVAPVVTPAVTATSVATSCLEWSDFSGTDLKRANEVLASLRLGSKLSQREIEYNIGYWVYIPPLKDKASITQKIAQLKARGVEEYFVLQEAGEWQHAISLGVFKSADAAQKFLESLAAKDVRSAKIGERASKLKATVFVFNGVDSAIVDKLNELKKDFPAADLKKLACR